MHHNHDITQLDPPKKFRPKKKKFSPSRSVRKLELLSPVPADIDIANSVEPFHISEIAKDLNLSSNHYNLYGKYKAKVLLPALDELQGSEDGYFDIGILADGTIFAQRNICCYLSSATIARTNFWNERGAAGGGYCKVILMDEFNLQLTGDIHAITAANNLLAAAIEIW
ncbi:10-formyltetrahydrofolate synthetase, putative [Theobroma cacao]|uniref:10-formyltetrahydrofolate synthetase, putative n=1 Tax=Theobroma cacao TaxID=3641 RepID=A0A061FQQ8_THECC|nr:10-formyltetrahydrofolate synthetase, putative [Theobroma cacao]